MITINGQKMGKSLGNFITLRELFTGKHKLLTQSYSPMTIRFFIMQAHYRSTLDFSNEALQAAEKGFQRLMNAIKLIPNLKTFESSSIQLAEIRMSIYDALNDDFNTPIALAQLFEMVRNINLINDGKESISADDKLALVKLANEIVFDVLGLKDEKNTDDNKIDGLMQLILQQRSDAKVRKDYAASDAIRDHLKSIGIEVKDGKEGATYTVNN
jgi:cysteinyl-tRNA synthetase